MGRTHEVRVIIVYTDELESISVDGIELEDIHAIRNKPIRDWFSASNGRDGWEGLIVEINKILDDEQAELNFEFQGPQENKHIFEECIEKLGFGGKADGLGVEDITARNMDEAVKAEHRGLYKRALDCYVRAADFGNSAEAQYIVAGYYYRCYKGEQSGIDVSAEDAIANAVDYYEKAALQGDARAQYKLYELFSEGEGVNQDWHEAVKWLTMAAESGDAVRQFELAEIYMCYFEDIYDDGVERDESEGYAEALKWYKKAAESEYVKAYVELGKFYNGYGPEFDEKEAIKWFKKAVEKGSAEAQYEMADFLEDEVERLECWKRAAEAGSLFAQHELAEYYYDRKETGQNGKAAFEWYVKVAERSRDSIEGWEIQQSHYVDSYISEAQYKLGCCYEYGYGVEIDQKKAFEWYFKAANGNYRCGPIYCDEVRGAQNEIGYRYELGKGTEQNLNSAYEWYKKSAENGNRIAQCNLGNLYENGRGVEQDLTASYEWYKKSAEKDWPRGQFNLGWCYEYGRGTAKDTKAAYEWYKKSAENGYSSGERCLGRCYDFAIGTEKDYTKAVEWYTKAVAHGDVRASYLLGQCYEYGTGVDKDWGKAREYYEKAFAGGDTDAANKLMLAEIKSACAVLLQKGMLYMRGLETLNQEKNLVSVYGLSCKEIFFSYDGSIKVNGKVGFVITDTGIYFKNRFETKCSYMSYEDLRKIENIGIGSSYSNRGDVFVGKYWIPSASVENYCSHVASLLENIRDIARKYIS